MSRRPTRVYTRKAGREGEAENLARYRGPAAGQRIRVRRHSRGITDEARRITAVSGVR